MIVIYKKDLLTCTRILCSHDNNMHKHTESERRKQHPAETKLDHTMQLDLLIEFGVFSQNARTWANEWTLYSLIL